MNNALNALLAMVGGFIGLAIVAVIVSPRAKTADVVGSTGGALATVITAAVSPVTGTGGFGGGGSSLMGGLSNFGGLDMSSLINDLF